MSQVILTRILTELNVLENEVHASQDVIVALRLHEEIAQIEEAAHFVQSVALRRAGDLCDKAVT